MSAILPPCWCGKPSVTLVSTAECGWSWVCAHHEQVFNRLKSALEQEDAEREICEEVSKEIEV